MQVKESSSELTTNNEVVLLSLTIINLSVNKPLPSECAASFKFPLWILSSAIFFSLLNLHDLPPSTKASGEGEKEDKLEKHRERPGARELSLRKHVLSIGMTLYRHRSHILWCKWNHLCHRAAPALGQGALTGH